MRLQKDSAIENGPTLHLVLSFSHTDNSKERDNLSKELEEKPSKSPSSSQILFHQNLALLSSARIVKPIADHAPKKADHYHNREDTSIEDLNFWMPFNTSHLSNITLRNYHRTPPVSTSLAARVHHVAIPTIFGLATASRRYPLSPLNSRF